MPVGFLADAAGLSSCQVKPAPRAPPISAPATAQPGPQTSPPAMAPAMAPPTTAPTFTWLPMFLAASAMAPAEAR